ncbi:MAG: hypothetical protein ABIQ52_01495, partial [Vicinamibacterales bacterium]
MEISVLGRHLTAIVNGVTIHDLNLDDPDYAEAARGPLSARARVAAHDDDVDVFPQLAAHGLHPQPQPARLNFRELQETRMTVRMT